MKDDQRFSQLSTAMRGLSLLAVQPSKKHGKGVHSYAINVVRQ